MAMKTRVLEMTEPVHLVCIRDRKVPINQYRLYLYYPAKDRYGYPTEHRKELTRYEDFCSVIFHIRDMFTGINLYRRSPDEVIAWNNRYCGKA